MSVHYVHRENGAITYAGIFQEGYSEEELDTATSSDLRTFLAPPPVISSTAFLDRLGADGPTLMQSPAFAFQMARLAAAGTIRLDDPDVVAGMQAAVQGGAITSERAAALLAP